MRTLASITLIALGLLSISSSCQEYDSWEAAMQDISTGSDRPSDQACWTYTNAKFDFATNFPTGWNVEIDEEGDKERRIIFYSGEHANFIIRLQKKPGEKSIEQHLKDSLQSLRAECKSCVPECGYHLSDTENVVFAGEHGYHFEATIFNARTRTLIDQDFHVIAHGDWSIVLICQGTYKIDKKAWGDAEDDFKTILSSFQFGIPTPTPVICPTCTPAPG